jgi:DNA transformation protein and related proteins
METLESLPNIGRELSGKLIHAGVASPAELAALGSKEAFVRIREQDTDACLSMLCALEGAVQGIRWHNLPEDKKRELKAFFRTLQH